MTAREPVAEIGAEDYRIVRHTHDVELARELICAELNRQHQEEFDEPGRYKPEEVGTPSQEWIRIVPALKNTYAEAQGWKFTYSPAKPGSRGAFRAVVFS